MPKRISRGTKFDDPRLRTLIGGAFIERITRVEAGAAPLRIGAQTWSTHDLAVQLGVVHTRAARLLTQAAESIGAKNVADLYRRSSPYTFAGVKGLGDTTMYVLWRLFESAGLDPDAWADAGHAEQALVSFRAMKHREQAAEARTVAAEKKRARQSRRVRHEAAVAAALP
jgi:hypothetical protein